jgi:excinuclease UvrABC ATPase subunit
VKEIERLSFLDNVGVGYQRSTRRPRCPGGRRSACGSRPKIGSQLVGVLILRTVDQHQRDNDRLIGTLGRLRASATPSSWSSTTSR